MHNGLMEDADGKLSKSRGERLSLAAIFDDCPPAALRFYLLQYHYRDFTPFSETALKAACAEGEQLGWTAADAFGDAHDVGMDARPFMGEKAPRASHAGLHFVHDHQDAEFVAHLAHAPQVVERGRMQPSLALNGFDQNGGRLFGDRRAHLVQVAVTDMVEPVDRRREALKVLRLAAGGDRRQGSPVESVGAGDDTISIRTAGLVMVFARHLDRAFHGFGAGVRKKDGIGERGVDQPLREAFLPGNAIEIRAMP